MSRSTRSRQRWAVHLKDYINIHSTTNTWRRVPRSVSKEPSLHLPIWLRVVDPLSVLPTIPQMTPLALPWHHPLTSTGVTSSKILKSLKRQRSPVSRPYNSSPSYTGLHTSQGWWIIIYPGSHWAASSVLVILIEGHQRSNSRTAWKKFHSACHIDYCCWFTLAENSDGWCLNTNHVFPFKTSAELSRTKGRKGGTVILCHQAMTRSSAAATGTMPTCHKCVCS